MGIWFGVRTFSYHVPHSGVESRNGSESRKKYLPKNQIRVVTPSSSYLELPNSTWPFSSKVHEITKFRISWSNSWKKLRFDQVRFAKIFKSWLIAKNEHRLGRFACSIKLLEVPNRGPWAKSLSLSDYSGLFWSEKSKLMKYKYVFIKCCSTISLLKS